MHEPRGRYVPLSAPRRFVIDLIHFARKVPSVPVSRMVDIGPLRGARAAHPSRPSWQVVFMKAFAAVAADHPSLRRALLSFPDARLYEHPQSICALALERRLDGEDVIVVGLFRAPERQSLAELQAALDRYKDQPMDEVGFFRQALRFSRIPRPLRRLMWWITLNVSGHKRAKRFGTFGLTSYGALGAESLHPISPLTCTLTFGPIDPAGRVSLKLIYDHRVMDGSFVARRLADIEAELRGPILDELRRGLGVAAA